MFDFTLKGSSEEDSEGEHRGLYRKHTCATTASENSEMHEYLSGKVALRSSPPIYPAIIPYSRFPSNRRLWPQIGSHIYGAACEHGESLPAAKLRSLKQVGEKGQEGEVQSQGSHFVCASRDLAQHHAEMTTVILPILAPCKRSFTSKAEPAHERRKNALLPL